MSLMFCRHALDEHGLRSLYICGIKLKQKELMKLAALSVPADSPRSSVLYTLYTIF